MLQLKIGILREMEQNSLLYRHDEMQARANLAADKGEPNTQKALNHLRSSEAHTAMFQKIKAICSKGKTSGFTSIEVPSSWPPAHSDQSTLQSLPDPKQATEWRIVDLPDETYSLEIDSTLAKHMGLPLRSHALPAFLIGLPRPIQPNSF